MRPVDLLPVVFSLADAVVALSESWAVENGKTVSCRAGCGACCRQLVPVSEVEALHLAEVVAAMPEDRRERVTERFRDACARAEPVLESLHAVSGEAAVAAMGEAVAPYFALGIACPFLEEESCSIHADRPAVCREYLVTSSPEHCARMDSAQVKRVPVPATTSSTLLYFSDGRGTPEPRFMPLIEALDWAAKQKEKKQARIPAAELMQNFMRRFSSGEPGPVAPKFALQFRVMGERVSIEADPPAERMRLDEALPVLKQIDDRLIEIAAAKNAQPVSCAKGCSACCRGQLVPVTPPEAYAILCMLGKMDAPRQGEIRSRFAESVARLEAAGLAGQFLRRGEWPTEEQARLNVRRYFELRLICPFLEEDACSIYEDRPFVCRQHLVTSPKELCVNPLDLPVKLVPMIAAPAAAMLRTASEFIGRPQYTVPLVLALEYAEAHREELDRTYPGEDVLRASIRGVLKPE